MDKTPTPYELEALKEIRAWKRPDPKWYDKTMSIINVPAEKVTAWISKIPGARWTLDKIFGKLVDIMNDLAHWTVSRNRIYDDYHEAGYFVSEPEHILGLDLSKVDEVIGALSSKYSGLAAAEGAASGFAGFLGIPADIVALVALNQRAIAEYATYCGFDITEKGERLFAMTILSLASSPDLKTRDVDQAELFNLAKRMAGQSVGRNMEQSIFKSVIQRIANRLGARLVRAKAYEIMPVVGAGVAAGFNAMFTNSVCKAAWFLYRERFLAEKYGAEILDEAIWKDKLLGDWDDFQDKW